MSVTPLYRPNTMPDRRVHGRRPVRDRDAKTPARSASRRRTTESVRREGAAAFVLRRTVWFVMMTGVVYMTSSLCGQVLLEQARGQGIRFVARSKDARRAEAQLRARINEMSSLDTVEAWAVSHGFLSPGQVAATQKGD